MPKSTHSLNRQVTILRGKTWYWKISETIRVRSAYGMEKHFSKDSIVKVEGGGTRRSGKFDKIKNGIHGPSNKTVEQVGTECPKTKELFYHPFWAVISQPIADTAEFYNQLGRLRPGIANTLFDMQRMHSDIPVRRVDGIFGEIDELSKECDLDAFTACVGLLKEAVNYSSLTAQFIPHYAHQTLSVFLRFISYSPFSYLAEDYFDFFREHYFEPYLHPDRAKQLDEYNLAAYIRYYQSISSIIDEHKVLRHHNEIPSICLFFAEKYLTPEIVHKIFELLTVGKYYESKKLPEFRNFVKYVRRWEDSEVKKKIH